LWENRVSLLARAERVSARNGSPIANLLSGQTQTQENLMPASFIIRKAVNGQFHFNLTAANNKTILSSETYRDKSGAQAGIQSVKANCAADANHDRRTSSGGDAYFVLLAANKEVIGRSETYSSKSSMERGIASVKRNGRKAVVRDET
jgi:uncharacterized protein YegP (UPF0339 family)